MLGKSRFRKILNNSKLTDEQIERLQSDMYALAEIFLDELSSKKRFQQSPMGIDTPTQKSDHER